MSYSLWLERKEQLKEDRLVHRIGVLVVAAASLSGLVFAQSLHTIDFEDYPATNDCEWGHKTIEEWYAPPDPAKVLPLETPWATFTGGQMSTSNLHRGGSFSTLVYKSHPVCSYSYPTITIAFKQPVSQLSMLVGVDPWVGYALTVRDDTGGVVRLPKDNPALADEIVYLPSINIRQVTITVDLWLPNFSGHYFYIDDIQFAFGHSPPMVSITALDPMPELLGGANGVLTDVEALSNLGVPVSSVVADRATRVVLRMGANRIGENLRVSILNDQGQPSGSMQEDGRLGPIESGAEPGQSVLQLTAVSTSGGPMAFAIYRPPPDFSRAGRDDAAPFRLVSIKVESLDSPEASSSALLKIARPPIILVHGLWGSTDDWDTFTPLVSDSRFFIRRAGYSYSLAGLISSSSPPYSASTLANATTSSLGFAFNAPYVLAEIELALADFRLSKRAAVAQVDVIAHSMGGTVTRTVKMLPHFNGKETFGAGYINRLITIGTPHLGSPLASQLLESGNTCIRNILAEKGNVAIDTATVAGSVVFGGTGDQRGDGWGGSLSGALTTLQTSDPVPTVLVAATITSSNLAGLECMVCASNYVRWRCPGNPMADKLTAQNWPTVFGQASDAVVPRTSQLANLSGREVPGVIHSAGLYELDFFGPTELEAPSNIPAVTIQLLNLSSQSAEFQSLR